MIAAGNAVQLALFAHLEGDADLIKFFRPRLIEGQDWPQFSFDGMISEWRHEPLGLVRHQAEFSIWADLQAIADTQDLSDRLSARLSEGFAVEGFEVIYTHMGAVTASPEAGSQLWRSRVSFEILTQDQEAI